MKEGVDPEWRRHPRGLPKMGIDASPTEATGLDRQQHAASSDGTGRHTAEGRCMRGEMDGPDRPMCHRPWRPSARTGARRGAQPSSPANPHGRRPHRHEHDRRLTWNTTHLYDLARQRAGGELVQRHHGAQAALDGTFDHAWVWATVAREGSPGVGSIRAHSMFAQAPLRFTPRPRRGPSSVSDEWALHRHGMRSSWRSMPSSSLLPHRSTSFPSANLLICMPR